MQNVVDVPAQGIVTTAVRQVLGPVFMYVSDIHRFGTFTAYHDSESSGKTVAEAGTLKDWCSREHALIESRRRRNSTLLMPNQLSQR